MNIDARVRERITPELVEAFRRDGAVCVRQLLAPDEVVLLREGIDANLAAPSPRAKVASRSGDPGFFIEDFCNWRDNESYRRVIFDSALPAAAGLLTGSRQIRLYHDHMLTKEPGTRAPTPWHQDQPYYIVAGSHRGPWLMPRSFMDSQAKWFPEGSLAELPDIEGTRARQPILGWELEPGDVVCFHMLALHASAGVDGDRRRRVFSVRFLGEDMRHAPRAWVTSPEFPGLAERLPAGAPMDDPLFPVLWTAA
jgi:ectoine hydroxylase-related dioxygenase (phytanoyl-CoA dioxygenase family)